MRLLEQHCLAHGIGLPEDAVAAPDMQGLQSLAAAVDRDQWHNDSAFQSY